MSVWQNVESLSDYVYKSMHVEIFKRRAEWFDKMSDMHMALWHIPEHHLPTPQEAKERLEYLQKNGESDFAFSFKRRP
jgi:Domain of unknown function (DUF3291)